MSLLKGRNYYKPFTYPEFYNKWDKHEKSHWLPSEVPMHDDVNDWKNRLKRQPKRCFLQIYLDFLRKET